MPMLITRIPRRLLPLMVAALLCAPGSAMAAPASVFLEDLTWQEIRNEIKQGTHTVLIPSGGTEQNGAHIALGKHNWIVRRTSQAIAETLEHTLVAPVIAYVPEGQITPLEGHMRFPGTISVREEVFEGLLEDTARSMKAAGFTLICFIGDSGGNQQAQARVADKLNKEWQGSGGTVLHVSDYYAAPGAQQWVTSQQGNSDGSRHGGFMDVAETLAAHKAGVRTDKLEDYRKANEAQTGVTADTRGATEAAGKKLLEFKIDAAVKQIRASLQ